MSVTHAARGDHPLPMCLANSAATLWHQQCHYDWVRAGIALYGASHTGCWQDISDTGLPPVMSLTREIIGIQQRRTGEAVDYGGRYCAPRRQRIGIVACGYAEGYLRHAPTGTSVMVGGQRTQLLGAVAMDMIAVDSSACPQADVGTSVELWGASYRLMRS